MKNLFCLPVLALSLMGQSFYYIDLQAAVEDKASPNQGNGSHISLASSEKVPVGSEARRLALETAGAFNNDGFRIRDAEWAFSLAKATPLFLQVTLFAGNHYWFVVATPNSDAKIRIILYDAQGHPLKSEQWQDEGEHGGSRAASGIVAQTSGTHYVGVELVESPSPLPLDCSLVSAYK